jgi:hypothetical protein
MHPVRDEWGERRQQSARDRQDLVKRRERRPVVIPIDVVEPVPALAHVPLRDVLIEERHYRLCCVGRLITAEQLVGLPLDSGQTREDPAIERWTSVWRRISI